MVFPSIKASLRKHAGVPKSISVVKVNELHPLWATQWSWHCSGVSAGSSMKWT